MSREDRLWLDHYFRLFGNHYVAGAVAGGFIVFLIGLAISRWIGFHESYVRTPAIYLGAFGIAWVAAWLGWGSRKIPLLISSIGPAFLLSKEEYQRTSVEWTRRFYCTRIHLSGSVLLVFASWVFVAVSALTAHLPWFPPGWSQHPHLPTKISILGIYAVGVVSLVFTTIVGIVVYCLFIIAISRTPLVPSVEFARLKLRATADFGVLTAVAWSVGVSLFILLLAPAFDLFSRIGVGVLVILGLLMALLPQYALHRALEKLKDNLLERAWLALTPQYGDNLFKNQSDRDVYGVMKSIADSRTWVYNSTDLLSMLGTWLIPLFTLAVDRILAR